MLKMNHKDTKKSTKLPRWREAKVIFFVSFFVPLCLCG